VCFEVISKIENIETIAVEGRIRDIMRLRRQVRCWPSAKAQRHCDSTPLKW